MFAKDRITTPALFPRALRPRVTCCKQRQTCTPPPPAPDRHRRGFRSAIGWF